MSLIKCIDCGKDFSTHAAACPFCGCPIEVAFSESAQSKAPEPVAQPPKVETPEPVAQPPKVETPEPPANDPPAPQENLGVEALVAPIIAPIIAPTIGKEPETAAPDQNNEKAEPENNNFKTAICPSCGSNQINFISTDYGVCKFCGSKVMLNTAEQNVTKAEVHIHADGAQNNAEFYGVKKTLDPETFYRDALLDLAKDTGTPPDLFDATFVPAEESNKHIGDFQGNVTGTYTAEIGYDKVRETREWNDVKKAYETKRENYIEWQSFAGNYAGSQRVVRDIMDDPMDEDIERAFFYSVELYDMENELEGTDDIVVPSQETIQSAMEDCKYKAEEDAKKLLPGDHSRNYSFSGFASLSHYTCFTIPAFSLPFTYQGEKYKKSFFAMKQHQKASFGHIPDISDDIAASADKKMRPLGLVALVLLALSIVCGPFCNLIREHVLRGVSIGITVSVFVLAFASTLLYFILKERYQSSVINTNLNAKIKGVKRVLKEKGLDPLSEEEENSLLGRKQS